MHVSSVITEVVDDTRMECLKMGFYVLYTQCQTCQGTDYYENWKIGLCHSLLHHYIREISTKQVGISVSLRYVIGNCLS